MENFGAIQSTISRAQVAETIGNMALYGFESRWENEALYFYKGDTKITSLFYTWVHGASYMIQHQMMIAE